MKIFELRSGFVDDIVATNLTSGNIGAGKTGSENPKRGLEGLVGRI
jgi:hypothetical protein